MEIKEIEARLLNRAYHYLGFRARSIREIEVYLKKKIERYKDLSLLQKENVIQHIIETLRSYDLINDSKFISSWITDRNNLKPKGQNVLKQELLQKGIPKDLIDIYFLENEIDEYPLALEALKKREKVLMGVLNPKKKFEKAINYLIRRGFSYSISKKAFEELFKKG